MDPHKVLIATSGGVDSSVAAAILVEQGYDCVAVFMRHGAAATDTPDGACDHEPAKLDHTACLCVARRQAGSVCTPAQVHSPRAVPPCSKAVVPHRSTAMQPDSHQGCCSAEDARDARNVASQLGIGFYAINFSEPFEELIEYFVDEYTQGRTPNPCIRCNNELKFGRLFDYADAIGARYVATGHHARIVRTDGPRLSACDAQAGGMVQPGGSTTWSSRTGLMRGVDADKDQSYVLAGIDRARLDRILLPVGELTKDQVRDRARQLGLNVADKPDSQEICFVQDQEYAALVRARRPQVDAPGPIIDQDGRQVGTHEGSYRFTIGQRRGVGVAAGTPVYVTSIDPRTNTVQIGPREALLKHTFICRSFNWLVDPPHEDIRGQVQIRYRHRAAPATVTRLDEHTVRVHFDKPQPAITPGQTAVVYDGDCVLGGGTIDQVVD